jgi:plastocyanin
MFRRAVVMAAVMMLLATSSVSAATTTVTVTNSGFTAKALKIRIGNSVKWKNTSNRRHSPTPTVNWSWTAVSVAAGTTSTLVTPTQTGTFPYFCSLHPTMKGKIKVPMVVSPLAGNTATYFTLTLGTVQAPGVLVHQVEVRRNGGAWTLRATTNAASHALFFPQTGTYDIRTRLRYQLGGATSGWSPVSTIQVL